MGAMKVIGIDPGVTGALAVVGDEHYPGGANVWDLPVASIGTTKQIDPRELTEVLALIGPVDLVVIEDNRANGVNGSKANFSMGLSLGIIHGVVAALDRPVLRVKPAQWQTFHGLTGPTLDSKSRKDMHRMRAIEKWPSAREDLKRAMDHNRADALLIAEYGRSTL